MSSCGLRIAQFVRVPHGCALQRKIPCCDSSKGFSFVDKVIEISNLELLRDIIEIIDYSRFLPSINVVNVMDKENI